jgi:hypothetical protein
VAQRIDITLAARVLPRIDAAAKAAGESGAGSIAMRVLSRQAAGPRSE